MMKKIIKNIIAVLGIAAALISASAHANVIDFDDAYSNSVINTGLSAFSVNGLTFTNNGFGMGIADGLSLAPNGNGTNSLIFAGLDANEYLAITRTGGGVFDLSSIDMTISFFDTELAETILVNGSPITISQGMQTFMLGLSGVSEVRLTSVPNSNGYWALDNVNFSVPVVQNRVPEPASLVLLALGLAGIGAVRRRKQC